MNIGPIIMTAAQHILKFLKKYVRELVADWLAAGRTYNGKGFTIDDELKWWHD